MFRKRSDTLPVLFFGDTALVLISVWIYLSCWFTGSLSRHFLWILILTIADVCWNWCVCVPSYIFFRASTGETHWSIDAFWALRFGASVIWTLGFFISLFRLNFVDLVITAVNIFGCAIITLYALKRLKSSSEDRFSHRRVAIL